MLRFFALLLLLPSLCFATDRSPWTGNPFEFVSRVRYTFETFNKIEQIPFHTDNHYLNLALLGTGWPSFDLEGQIQVAYTPYSGFFFDYGEMAGRYVWLDDVAGEPLTVTTALAVFGASKRSVLDPSTPVTGQVGGELQALIGKEWSLCGDWISRHWLMGAVGLAHQSSGWLRWRVATERHFCLCHTVWIDVGGRIGLGDHPMPAIEQFTGYGPIDYRSIDLRAGYRRDVGNCGEIELSYLYRLYSENFPDQLHRVAVEILIPFSL